MCQICRDVMFTSGRDQWHLVSSGIHSHSAKLSMPLLYNNEINKM